MTRANRACLQVESLDDRLTPSATLDAPHAFEGLAVAADQIVPPNPIRVSPVFAANFGPVSAEPTHAVVELNNVLEQLTPGDPCRVVSPVLYGLSNGPIGDGGDTVVV